MSVVTELNVEELSNYLCNKGLHEDVVAAIHDNKITGAIFVCLTKSDLKELAPTIGARITLRNLINKVCKVNCYNFFF